MLQGDQSGAANHKAGAAAGAGGGGGFEIEDFDDLSDHEGTVCHCHSYLY